MKYVYAKNIVHIIVIAIAFIVTLSYPVLLQGQCDPSVPHFNVNLTSSGSASWTSPSIARNGLCCGVVNPDRCIHFSVTLSPNSQGIIFDITSGAIPTGAMYYMVGCANPIPVGQVLCLNGTGPHEITFCKPGNNPNEYTITSVPKPFVSDPTVVSENCNDTLFGYGYASSTIQWNSVYPGAVGSWNSLLSSTTNDTVLVTVPSGITVPPYVDFEICGMPAGPCQMITVCDTVRVYITPPLEVTISPDTSILCPGSKLIELTATITGGAAPHTLMWSTGATASSIYAGPGQYTVTVTDSTGCPSAVDTAIVIFRNIIVETFAGPDITICQEDMPAMITGSFSGSAGATWTGDGIIMPHPDSMSIAYYPTPSELMAGVAYLKLNSVGNYGCPPDSDYVEIRLPKAPVVDAGSDDTICLGNSTQLQATGGNIFSWIAGTATLSDSTIADPIATPTTTTSYVVMSVDTSGQLVTNGNMAMGNTGFVSNYIYQYNLLSNGYYYVGNDPNANNANWISCGDATGDGMMMIVNGASTPNVPVWQQTVPVTPNTDYVFSTWVSNTQPINPAELQFSINGVLQDVPFVVNQTPCIWSQYYITWNSGANTSAVISIVNQNTTSSGNDFALDGISFAPICAGYDTVTVYVDEPPTADAGPDQAICEDAVPIATNGSFSNGITSYWSGAGAFSPSASSLSIDYIPTAGEISAGSAIIYFNVAGSPFCADAIDSMQITIIHNPNLDAGPNDTLCFGDSLQLHATGADAYIWSPTGSMTDPFIANPLVYPSVSTTYYVLGYNQSSQLSINSSFNAGNSGFTNAYTYQSNLANPGNYYVGTNPAIHNPAFENCSDHTTGTGEMLIVNGTNGVNETVWEQNIPVIPNTDYLFTYWVLNVQNGTTTNLQSGINGNPYGTVTAIDSTGCQWIQLTETWNSGTNTTVDLSILTQPSTTPGNNFAIDDIYFGPLCMAEDSVHITVTPQHVDAGPDGVVCEGVPYYINMATASNYSSVLWTSSGTGTFDDPTILNPTYTPSHADALTGGVTLTVTVLGLAPCIVPVQDTMFLLVHPKPLTSLIYHY